MAGMLIATGMELNLEISSARPQNPAALGAQGLFQANLAGPLGHRHQHDVHDADAAYQQGDAGNPDELVVGGVTHFLKLLGLLQQVLTLVDKRRAVAILLPLRFHFC